MNAKTYKNEALESIEQLFGDTTISKQETLDLLCEIEANLASKIGNLRRDIANENEVMEE